MNLLFLAPHPFYQERGTPIAVRLMLESLTSEFKDLKIDLVTYHEGENVPIKNVEYHRVPCFNNLSGIRAGISIKKLFCDVLMFYVIVKLLFKNGIRHYRAIHAVEESVFFALVLKFIFKIPYIYDMDSLLSLQTIEKWKKLNFLSSFFIWLENIAIKQSDLVIAVCQALYDSAQKAGAKNILLLRDVPPQYLPFIQPSSQQVILRDSLEIDPEDKILTYIGNLEIYQGIDLLLDGFNLAFNEALKLNRLMPKISLVIIGGPNTAIEAYKRKISSFSPSVLKKIFFIGPKPLGDIEHYLNESDILVSPRILGNNTPMKIYGFLASGKPVIATNISSHTEILNDQNSILIDPKAENLCDALLEIDNNFENKSEIGRRAKLECEEMYSLQSYQEKVGSTELLRG